jgi:signal transduction histidine kinase
MQESVIMRLLRIFRSLEPRSLQQEKRASHFFPCKSRPQLRILLTVRLALGFFLAALFAATTAGIIGVQHADALGKQSDFYQALLQTNILLTNGSALLKSIDGQSTKMLKDAATVNPPPGCNPALDEQKLSALMTRYDNVLFTYNSHDLLIQHPDQITLLGSDNPQMLIEQQRTRAAGALHTWQVYRTIQNEILQDIRLGNIAQAQHVARLQGEPAYADALSALHSLSQCNENLFTLVAQGASKETEQQLSNTLLGSFVTFLGVLLMCIGISHPLVRRLKQLHQVTQAVEQGQTDARVPVIGNDEITDVSKSVNKMLNSLVEAIRQTVAAKQQLDHAYQQERLLNQMKDQFIRNVSHEIRTPLTEIYGFLQLLQEHKGQVDASMQTLFIEQALNGCEDLLSLFTTILDAAQIGATELSPKLEKLSLCPIIKSVLEQYDPREREDHPIYLEVPESFTVWADSQYLHRILRNLISNAFKYTPPETCIFIRAGWHETKHGASSEPSHMCICVKDTGPGIPPDEQETLFQQFVRLTRDLSGTIRGTGLGLYLCQQLVEAMNGQIWVESSGITGEGSAFYFTLPVAPSEPYEMLALSAKGVDM